jgi:hypothetical protein
VKRLAAIILTLLFAFAQYSRQFRFLECVFANDLAATTTSCDCEKIAGLDKPDSTNSLPKAHTHSHPDDIFSFSVPLTILFLLQPFNKEFVHTREDECEGVSVLPQQPPES